MQNLPEKLVKERFTFFILILLTFVGISGLAVKPVNPEVEYAGRQSAIREPVSMCLMTSPSMLNCREVKITRLKGDDLLFSFFAYLCLPAMPSHCPANVSFQPEKNISDLSYWGQRIQTLSSRSHPPTKNNLSSLI